MSVTDGPFTETKEVVGGFVLVQVPSMAHAIDLATRFMEIHLRRWPEFEGSLEIRPVEGEPAPEAASAGASESASR